MAFSDKKIKHLFAVLGILFFLTYSWFSFSILQGGAVKFNSPYDTASYFFTKQFINEKKFAYPEPYLALSNNLAHPRSMSEYNGFVVPTIFLGFLILLGIIGFVVGPYGILFVVPLVSAATPYFFYQVLKRLFSNRVALLSALLLFINPAFWYYASRSMLPNALLIDLLIICAYFFILGIEKKKWYFSGAAGLAFGSALAIRPNDFIWIVPLCGIAWWALRAHLTRTYYVLFFTATAFILLVYGFFNYQTFGSAFAFGYKIQSFSTALGASPSFQGDIIQKILSLFFPFGFHPRLVLHTFWNYAVLLQWWFVITGIIGFFVSLPLLKNEFKKKIRSSFFYYTLIFSITSIWLLCSYGSFEFVENVTGQVTLGNSYVRYWLPIFVLSLPYVSLLIIKVLSFLFQKLKNNVLIGVLAVGIFLLFSFFSARLVYWQTNESLVPIVGHIRDYQQKSAIIQSLVPPHAVIFSRASDKIFFPERKSGASFSGFREVSSLTPLLHAVPVYYYGLWSDNEIEKINSEHFTPLGYRLSLVVQLDRKEKLFIVMPVTSSK